MSMDFTGILEGFDAGWKIGDNVRELRANQLDKANNARNVLEQDKAKGGSGTIATGASIAKDAANSLAAGAAQNDAITSTRTAIPVTNRSASSGEIDSKAYSGTAGNELRNFNDNNRSAGGAIPSRHYSGGAAVPGLLERMSPEQPRAQVPANAPTQIGGTATPGLQNADTPQPTPTPAQAAPVSAINTPNPNDKKPGPYGETTQGLTGESRISGQGATYIPKGTENVFSLQTAVKNTNPDPVAHEAEKKAQGAAKTGQAIKKEETHMVDSMMDSADVPQVSKIDWAGYTIDRYNAAIDRKDYKAAEGVFDDVQKIQHQGFQELGTLAYQALASGNPRAAADYMNKASQFVASGRNSRFVTSPDGKALMGVTIDEDTGKVIGQNAMNAESLQRLLVQTENPKDYRDWQRGLEQDKETQRNNDMQNATQNRQIDVTAAHYERADKNSAEANKLRADNAKKAESEKINKVVSDQVHAQFADLPPDGRSFVASMAQNGFENNPNDETALQSATTSGAIYQAVSDGTAEDRVTIIPNGNDTFTLSVPGATPITVNSRGLNNYMDAITDVQVLKDAAEEE